MGTRADLVRSESQKVRELFYNDGYYCRDVREHSFDRYILDNQDNRQALQDALTGRGIKLVIAPTGSGKSASLIEVAEQLTRKDRTLKVVIALPTRALALQMGTMPYVYALVGGKNYLPEEQIIATTYEKLYVIQDKIRVQKALGIKGKNILIYDECHNLCTQHKFREEGIKLGIRGIEKHLYDSVLLVTATPGPMSLFRCDRILDFKSTAPKPVMDKLEIVLADDVVEYIRGLDFSKCFPFVRVNDKGLIEKLSQEFPQYAVLTSDNYTEEVYDGIIENSTVSSRRHQGILATSFIEAGVNIVDYPDNMLMVCAFADMHMSLDSIEQFFNRVRRTGTKHIGCAKVVLPKPRENTACLLDSSGSEVCTFHDITVGTDEVTVSDTYQMDGLADGRYKISFSLCSGRVSRYVWVKTKGTGGDGVYLKDSKPVRFTGAGFRSFMNILKANKKRAERFREVAQIYVDALEGTRKLVQTVNRLSDNDMIPFIAEDEKLMGSMTELSIRDAGELKQCLSYKDGKVEVDKRILYMVSYSQFQRQYLHDADRLKKELEDRLKADVEIVEADTGRGKKDYNPYNIWKGIEHLRTQIVCTDEFYNAVMGRELNQYTSKWTVHEIRCQKQLKDMMEELEGFGMSGGAILRVLANSKRKGRVTNYLNAYKTIVSNQTMNRFGVVDVGDIPLYNRKVKDKLNLVVYCYLKQKGQVNYTVNDMLAGEITGFYKAVFPMDVDFPTEKAVKKKIKEMYKMKDKKKNVIKMELRLKEEEIFDMVNPDYK